MVVKNISVTLRIPEDIYEELNDQAKKERRSINNLAVVYMIRQLRLESKAPALTNKAE